MQYIKKFFVYGLPVFFLLLFLFIFKVTDLNQAIIYGSVFVILLLDGILIVFQKKLPKVVYKILIIIVYGLSLFILIYNVLYQYDLLKYFSSITATKELILSTGHKGTLTFILIQIAQVVFLPIPAVALLVVGLVIYGPLLTFVYCTVGVLVGSYISFMIGKSFGYKFVSWILGEHNINKYSRILQNNGKYILGIVFIFPFFPDDLFCMVAGISSMRFKDFFIISTTIRPISIFIMCFLGGGAIFKLDSITGIIFALLVLIISIVLIIMLFKKNKRIKSLFVSIKK